MARSQQPGAVVMNSYETVCGWQGHEHRRWGIYSKGSHYQAMTGEDKADWENLVSAVANCKVCKLVKLLQLLDVLLESNKSNYQSQPYVKSLNLIWHWKG
jgi:hypothetical protein